MYNIQSIVAKNIADYRKKHQLSLDKVANATGVSKNMLSQIEKGQSNPTITTLWKIANGLHISLSQLTSTSNDTIDFIDESDIIPLIDKEVSIFRFNSDLPHSYFNPGTSIVALTSTMYYQ